MTPPVVVPDASVLLKWVLGGPREPEFERALQLRDRWLAGHVTLVVPALWTFEVGNVLALKASAQAPALLRSLIELAMDQAPAGEFMDEALELCKTFKVTFYDAAYHALARSRKGTFVTADEKYVRHVGGGDAVALRTFV